MIFKTSEECAVELIAHTVIPFPATGEMHEHFGNVDLFPATAARVSFGNDLNEHDQAKDEKLINYLAEHKHTSTFEHQSLTVMVECPLFVRAQVMRHRHFSYNEISRRYTSEALEFWIPDKFRGQAVRNKQASSGEVIEEMVDLFSGDRVVKVRDVFTDSAMDALAVYTNMIDAGVAREIARAVLPQSLLSRFYMTGNLRAWENFVKLRADEHSQKEIQVVANKISAIIDSLWPTSWRALIK